MLGREHRRKLLTTTPYFTYPDHCLRCTVQLYDQAQPVPLLLSCVETRARQIWKHFSPAEKSRDIKESERDAGQSSEAGNNRYITTNTRISFKQCGTHQIQNHLLETNRVGHDHDIVRTIHNDIVGCQPFVQYIRDGL